MKILNGLAPYWKAVVGFFAPAASQIILATTENSHGGENITQNEIIVALATSVVTAGAVFTVRNKDVRGH